MSDNLTSEAPPPVSQEQSGGENNGAANLDDNAFAKMLAKREAAKAEAVKPAAEDSAIPNKESAPPAEEAQVQSEAESEEPEVKTDETKEEAGEVLSNETKLDPKLQTVLNKRIGREVAKTKREIAARAKAEAERDQLKAQLEAMNGGTPETPQSLPEIDSVAALEKHEHDARLTIRWVDAQLDRDDFPAEGIKTEEGVLTKAALKQIRMNARIALEDHIPAQRKFLQEREAARQRAYEAFPYLKDPESEEYAEAQAAYQANPWLKNVPNADWIIGVQLLGLKALKEREAAAKKPKSDKPAPKPMNGQAHVSSNASPSRVPADGNQSAISAIKQNLYKKNGASERDVAAYFKQRELLKNS